MERSIEERLKSRTLGSFPESVFRELYTAYRHKGGYEFSELDEGLEKKLRSTTLGELPERVFERVPLEKIADKLFIYETFDVLQEYLSTKEHQARRFKVVHGYDLNCPAPDAKRVSRQLEEGWKEGFMTGSYDYLTFHVATMYLLDGEFDKAVETYVAKSESNGGTVLEGYEARCREMLAEVAADIKEPINALREKYGQKPQ